MKKNLKSLMAFSLSAVLLLTGCGQKEQTETGSEAEMTGIERLVNKEEFILATDIYDEVFDPCMGWGQHADPVFQSKLFKVMGAKLEKDLATDYSVSEDGLTWTFTIRDDVKFHDGEKLTAHDVAFTYNNTKALASSIDLTAMDEAVAIDDTTVEFRMSSPYSAFLHTTATLGIVPEHAYGDSDSYSKNPIGSGPMKFVQYDEGQQLIMERNDDYYGKKANFKKIVVVIMTEDAAFAAVKAGTADLALVNSNLAQNDVEGYYLKTIDTYDYRVISFPTVKSGGVNEKDEPMGNDVTSNLAIRKALSIGISRDAVVEQAMMGFGEKTFDPVGRFAWGIESAVAGYEDGNIEEAIKILEEDGWMPGADGVREKDGVKAEFELMYGASALDRQAVAISVAEQAKALGINIIPVGLDWSEIEPRTKSTPLVLGGGQYNPMLLTRLYDGKYAEQAGYRNVACYSNPKTDEYIEKAISALTDEEANKYWQMVQWDGEQGPGVLGDVAYLPVCYLKRPYFVREGVTIGENVILPHDQILITPNRCKQLFS